MRTLTARPPGWLVRTLVPLVALLSWSCSGQQQEDEQLEVMNEQYGGNYQSEEGENYQSQEGYGQQGAEEGAEGENYASNSENYGSNSENYGSEGTDSAGGENYASQGAEDYAAEGEEEDLQEIIQEMNGQQAAAGDPMADAPMAQPADAGMAMDTATAGADYAAAPPPPAGGAMPAPMNAAAPPPSAGPAIPFQPGGSPAGPALPEMGSKMPYVVQSGDTLAKIATKVYGDPSRWNEMASLSGLANPSRIYPGDLVYYTLDEQSLAFATAYESVARMEEMVQPGDTLATIAQRVLGSSNNWRALWRQNDRIDNPDIVPPGTTVYYIQDAALAAEIAKVKQQIAAAKDKVQETFAIAQNASDANDTLSVDISVAPEQIDSILQDVVDSLSVDMIQPVETRTAKADLRVNQLSA